MVSSSYDAGRICYNDLLVLSVAFSSEPIPRYNTQATAIAAVLGQMDIFNWAIAADYRYSSYDYKQASDARDIDLQTMIDHQKYRAEAPVARYPSIHSARIPSHKTHEHETTRSVANPVVVPRSCRKESLYDRFNQHNVNAYDKYRASRRNPYDNNPKDNSPLENLPQVHELDVRGRARKPSHTPYYDVYSHSNEFYGIENDDEFFGSISAETSSEDAMTVENATDNPSQKQYGGLSRDDILELAGRYKLSHHA